MFFSDFFFKFPGCFRISQVQGFSRSFKTKYQIFWQSCNKVNSILGKYVGKNYWDSLLTVGKYMEIVFTQLCWLGAGISQVQLGV